VKDSEHNVWIVGSPDATNWTSRESEDAQKVDARATDKASHTAKAWSTFKPKAKVKVSGGRRGGRKSRDLQQKSGETWLSNQYKRALAS
jgi:inorganic pyrophosphatase